MDRLSNEEGKKGKLSAAGFAGSGRPLQASPARAVLNAKELLELVLRCWGGRGGAWAKSHAVLGRLVVLTASEGGTTVTRRTHRRLLAAVSGILATMPPAVSHINACKQSLPFAKAGTGFRGLFILGDISQAQSP